MSKLHLTTIAHASGLIMLTDAQLSVVISMAINANRTRRTFDEALSKGDLSADLGRALAKNNSDEEAAWLIQNVHAIAEGAPRPTVVIKNEYHHAIIDDAWAWLAAGKDEYSPSTEEEEMANADFGELERTVGRFLSRGEHVAAFDHLARKHVQCRAARQLLWLSNSIRLEVRTRFRLWNAGQVISEPEFHRVCALLGEQTHCLYVLDRSDEIAENLVYTAVINAQANQFRDSIIYVYRALIHGEREGLPRWQCKAYSIKLQIDSSLGNVESAEECRDEIRRLVAANAGEPWTEEIRPLLQAT